MPSVFIMRLDRDRVMLFVRRVMHMVIPIITHGEVVLESSVVILVVLIGIIIKL